MSIARPLVSCLQCAFGEYARDMALIIRRRLHAAAGIDHPLHRCRYVPECRFGCSMPNETPGCRARIDRGLADSAKGQTNLGAFLPSADRHHRGHAGYGKIAAPAGDLPETPT